MDMLGSYWAEHWLLAILMLGAIAFVAGFVDSIAGGGGLFLVPGFLLVGMPPQVALGQEKLVSTLGTLAAIRNFLANSKMVWQVALVGVPFSLLGAYLGAHLIVSISQETVGKIILALIPLGILIFLTPKDRPVEERELSSRMLYTVVPLTCLVIGFYDGFFGPGTGSMFIIAFHYLLRMDLVSSSANSKPSTSLPTSVLWWRSSAQARSSTCWHCHLWPATSSVTTWAVPWPCVKATTWCARRWCSRCSVCSPAWA